MRCGHRIYCSRSSRRTVRGPAWFARPRLPQCPPPGPAGRVHHFGEVRLVADPMGRLATSPWRTCLRPRIRRLREKGCLRRATLCRTGHDRKHGRAQPWGPLRGPRARLWRYGARLLGVNAIAPVRRWLSERDGLAAAGCLLVTHAKCLTGCSGGPGARRQA